MQAIRLFILFFLKFLKFVSIRDQRSGACRKLSDLIFWEGVFLNRIIPQNRIRIRFVSSVWCICASRARWTVHFFFFWPFFIWTNESFDLYSYFTHCFFSFFLSHSLIRLHEIWNSIRKTYRYIQVHNKSTIFSMYLIQNVFFPSF